MSDRDKAQEPAGLDSVNRENGGEAIYLLKDLRNWVLAMIVLVVSGLVVDFVASGCDLYGLECAPQAALLKPWPYISGLVLIVSAIVALQRQNRRIWIWPFAIMLIINLLVFSIGLVLSQ